MKGWDLKHVQQLKANGKIRGYNIAEPADKAEHPKKAKYRNKKTVVDDIEFDSEKEAKRYKELKLLLKKGDIGFLARQVEYVFHLNGGVIASYFADFQYITKEGSLVVEDVKSKITRTLPVYRLKRRLMLLEHNIKILEI